MQYQEITTYSPTFDCYITRLSTVNRHGHEFFCLVPRERAKRWRELRDEALQQIAAAIVNGAEPGQIFIRLDA